MLEPTTNIQYLSVEQLRTILHDLHRALALTEAGPQERRCVLEAIDRVEKTIATKLVFSIAPRP